MKINITHLLIWLLIGVSWLLSAQQVGQVKDSVWVERTLDTCWYHIQNGNGDSALSFAERA